VPQKNDLNLGQELEHGSVSCPHGLDRRLDLCALGTEKGINGLQNVVNRLVCAKRYPTHGSHLTNASRVLTY
jgi:hypothetical protein